jgi:hypothetical protein
MYGMRESHIRIIWHFIVIRLPAVAVCQPFFQAGQAYAKAEISLCHIARYHCVLSIESLKE